MSLFSSVVESTSCFLKEHGYRTSSIGKIFHPMGRKMGNNPDDYQKSWTDFPFFVKPEVNISNALFRF